MGDTRWPLVGREAECETLAGVLAEDPFRGVVIAGAAGVGRTRMAREALALVGDHHRRAAHWVTANGATSRLPFGALAHLLPIPEQTDSWTMLQRAGRALADDHGGATPVLAVDDVDLLDDLSLALLHQLAASRVVPLVLTVRTDTATPDPVAALWKDGTAVRVELSPLSRTDTTRLLVDVLGGHVESRTLERLWQLTRGNPLFLREMVDDGLQRRLLTDLGGVWRWEGPMAPSQRLSDIVLSQLRDLDPVEWRAFEAIARAEPVAVRELVEVSGPDSVAALERRSLVVPAGEHSPGRLRAAHPVFAAVARRRSSEAGLQLLQRRLADHADNADHRGHVDRAGRADLGDGLAQWCGALLDGGLTVPGTELVTEGARRAMSVPDLALAERLARAALAAGGGIEASLVLAEVLRWQGEPGESERVAVEASGRADTAGQRARLVVARALTLLFTPGRSHEAREALAAESASGDGGEELLLAAVESILSLYDGDVGSAVARARQVRRSAACDSQAWLLATAAAAVGLALTGQTTEALEAAESGRLALGRCRCPAESLFVRVALAHAEVVALHLAGRLEELQGRAAQLHAEVLAAPEWAGDGVASLHCGWAALAGGRVQLATRWLTEARVRLRRIDPVGMASLADSLLAIARDPLGDVQDAPVRLDGECVRADDELPLFRPVRALAEACLTGADGRAAEARRQLFRAAALAAEQGQSGMQALLLHRTIGPGEASEVAAPLALLADRMDAPLIDILALHAAAVAGADVARVEAVGRQLQETGALRQAADAFAEAAALYERHGDRRRSADSRTKAMLLMRWCGVSESPAGGRLTLPTLTLREEEVAALASHGLGNQAIADRLVLSVRTVEAHLSHVYTKFGITSRGELEAALRAASSTSADRGPTPRTMGRVPRR